MILYHFIHWPLAMGTTKVAPGNLAIDCLRPNQWCDGVIDDACVWLTANPDPTPENQSANVCPYVRIEMRLPRTWRLKRDQPRWDLADAITLDVGSAEKARQVLKALRRDWWKSYKPIPREYFTAIAVTGEPFWCSPAEADMLEAA